MYGLQSDISESRTEARSQVLGSYLGVGEPFVSCHCAVYSGPAQSRWVLLFSANRTRTSRTRRNSRRQRTGRDPTCTPRHSGMASCPLYPRPVCPFAPRAGSHAPQRVCPGSGPVSPPPCTPGQCEDSPLQKRTLVQLGLAVGNYFKILNVDNKVKSLTVVT